MNDEGKRMLNQIEDLLLRTRDLVGSEPASPDMTKKVELALLRPEGSRLDGVRLAQQMVEWPQPTVEEPDQATLEEWMWADGGCEATDGCWTEPDGTCLHGHPAWLLRLGLI
ncbi:hypothetical protein LCGC14_1708720 [marine sediment metagenome]|uniref:Uncharacterized protein n=1 Tax=marine sediment metagenome TaxID=412755 RepID=A0A0F9HFE1_9ZZZZ